MLKVITESEILWQECAKLVNNARVVNAELFGDPNDHFVLAYGPVAQRNQFQALLYSAKDNFNVSILPIQDLELLGNIPWPGKVICHFHWLHDKTKVAKTEEEANAAVIYWENIIRRIKENGHKIVWTVHNVMPHESFWIKQDIKIHQMMADAADALHVMASDSPKLTEKYYKLDERKMFVVPHPTYEGAQPDEISKEEARAQLRIDKDDFVFLSFGAIMEYKGYDRLMAAYDKLRGKTTKKTKLIIAGLPSDKNLVEKIALWGKNKPDVILDMTAVPQDKLQIYFRSADWAVCPYTRTMNSGAAMMALTFDLPVLGPNSGGFLDIEKMGGGITFDNNIDDTLLKKMHFITDRKVIAIAEFDGAKKRLLPKAVSALFFSNIIKVVS